MNAITTIDTFNPLVEIPTKSQRIDWSLSIGDLASIPKLTASIYGQPYDYFSQSQMIERNTGTAAVNNVLHGILESITFGDPRNKTFQELQSLKSECSQSNWDGYGAEPLSTEVFIQAQRFVESFPLDFVAPEISAASNGDISFDWAQTPFRIVSVGISANGYLHFAGLHGQKRCRGSMPISTIFDSTLQALICDVVG